MLSLRLAARRQNFAAAGRTWAAKGERATARTLFQSALFARSPSVIIRCPVIFFNHRSPRRSVRAHFDGRASKGFGRASRAGQTRCDVHRLADPWTKRGCVRSMRGGLGKKEGWKRGF